MKDIKASKLKHVPTREVYPNPHNPRSLFDRGPLDTLKKSIDKVGILTPLLIYERKKDGRLIILDGQRRWICANELKIEEVPANIIEEPDTVSNLLYMFNIHNIRESWELMPTALKLEVIMRQLKTRSDSKLAQLTGLSSANVNRCKILLSYPKNYQDMMVAKNLDERIKADFFIEMHPVLNLIERDLPKIAKAFSREKLISIFLKKYGDKLFTNVVHFRKLADLIRSIKKGTSVEEVESIFLEFISKEETPLKQIEISIEEISNKLQLKKEFVRLSDNLSRFKVIKISEKDEFLKELIKLKEIIDKKISEILKRKGE